MEEDIIVHTLPYIYIYMHDKKMISTSKHPLSYSVDFIDPIVGNVDSSTRLI